VIVAVSTVGYVVLIVFALIVLVALFETGRLVWRLMRGDEEIESTSFGKQFFGRQRDEEMK
jgi:hypothetical protein